MLDSQTNRYFAASFSKIPNPYMLFNDINLYSGSNSNNYSNNEQPFKILPETSSEK